MASHHRNHWKTDSSTARQAAREILGFGLINCWEKDLTSECLSKNSKMKAISDSKFSRMHRISNVTQLPRLPGISPDNMLLDTSDAPNFPKILTSSGKEPFKLLWDKFSKMDKFDRLKSSLGIVPLRLFWERSNPSKFLHKPKLEGTPPWILFCPKYSEVKFVRLPRKNGMFPDNLYLDNNNLALPQLHSFQVDKILYPI